MTATQGKYIYIYITGYGTTAVKGYALSQQVSITLTVLCVTFCHRSNVAQAAIGLAWHSQLKHWAWKRVPVTYTNKGPHVTTPTGYGWRGLVTAEDGGHWTYDRQYNTHHFICQSMEGEISKLFGHYIITWLVTLLTFDF